MGTVTRLAGIVATGILGVLPSARLHAQEVQDTVYDLPTITVDAQRVPPVPAGRSLAQHLEAIDPTVNRTMPLGSVYVDIPNAGQVYINGVKVLFNTAPNMGIIQGIHAENRTLERGSEDALTPALDATYEVKTRVQEGLRASARLFEQSAAFGDISEHARVAASMQRGGLPPKVSRQSDLNLIGETWRGDITATFGPHLADSTAWQVTLEGQGLTHKTDVSDMLSVAGYTDENTHYFTTGRLELPVGAARVQTTVNHQRGDATLTIWERAQNDSIERSDELSRSQDLTFTTAETSLQYKTNELGIAAFRLTKHSTFVPEKQYSGWQAFASHSALVHTGYPTVLVRVNGSADIVQDTPYASAYASLETQVTRGLNIKMSAASTYDPTSAEALRDNIAELIPGPGVVGQRIEKASAQLSYSTGPNTFWASADIRDASMPQLGGQVRGAVYRGGYQLSTSQFSFSSTLTDRNLRIEEERLVPGSPDKETNTKATVTLGPHTLASSFVWRNNTPFPAGRTRTSNGAIIDLGEQKIVNIEYRWQATDWLTVDGTLSNISQEISENYIAQVGNNKVELPFTADVGATILFNRLDF